MDPKIIMVAQRIDARQRALERPAVRTAESIGRALRVQVLRALASGRPLTGPMDRARDALAVLFARLMAAAHLQGRSTALELAGAAQLRRRRRFATDLEGAIDSMMQRMALPPDQAAALTAQYGPAAMQAAKGFSAHVNQQVSMAITEGLAAGESTRDLTATVRGAFDRAGVRMDKPWLFETIARTQAAIAQTAGQLNANADPAIDSIIASWSPPILPVSSALSATLRSACF